MLLSLEGRSNIYTCQTCLARKLGLEHRWVRGLIFLAWDGHDVGPLVFSYPLIPTLIIPSYQFLTLQPQTLSSQHSHAICLSIICNWFDNTQIDAVQIHQVLVHVSLTRIVPEALFQVCFEFVACVGHWSSSLWASWWFHWVLLGRLYDESMNEDAMMNVFCQIWLGLITVSLRFFRRPATESQSCIWK